MVHRRVDLCTRRLQLDYYHVGADSGKPSKYGEVGFFEIRRFRIGEDAWFADRHLEIKVDADTNLDSRGAPSVFYNRMTNLFANIVVDDAFKVKVGKQEPHFGYDREVSDTLQPFFERSFFDDQIFNKTANDYASGATVYGNLGHFAYLGSMYSLSVDNCASSTTTISKFCMLWALGDQRAASRIRASFSGSTGRPGS